MSIICLAQRVKHWSRRFRISSIQQESPGIIILI